MEDSGLSGAMIDSLGWYSLDAEAVSAVVGFQVRSGGIAIPYPGCDWVRVRLDRPHVFTERITEQAMGNKAVITEREREAKYLSPRGSANHAFILPEVRAALNNPTTAIGITEGEKKAAKATQDGFPTIGLPGVWSWKGRVPAHLDGKGEVSEKGLLCELAEIDWTGRHVFIFWDSDAFGNSKVLDAGRTLEGELRRRNANARLVAFPAKPDGSKVGLDDYLKEHTVSQLLDYAKEVRASALDRDFDIVAIEKLNTRPPRYRVALSWGSEVAGLAIEDLLTWARFRRAVAAASNRVPVIKQKRGEDTWEQYISDAFATCLYEEDVPDEVHMETIWFQRISRYLLDKATTDPRDLVENDQPYTEDGTVWFKSGKLLEYLNRRYQDKFTSNDMWDILHRRGAQTKTKTFWIDKERHNDRYCRLPAEAFKAKALDNDEAEEVES